ncbi:hypothetical protein AVEN_123763-1 [Araneus ventricosus]|uniref:Uncharacterized protein n=1 Tax=Araneus ventricosus TaxID=182803 RepID=A0A4Y2BJY9_ARAVE|nr:hypothetical protein AVEN_123763-1 [Araneus ventricosus]
MTPESVSPFPDFSATPAGRRLALDVRFNTQPGSHTRRIFGLQVWMQVSNCNPQMTMRPPSHRGHPKKEKLTHLKGLDLCGYEKLKLLYTNLETINHEIFSFFHSSVQEIFITLIDFIRFYCCRKLCWVHKV